MANRPAASHGSDGAATVGRDARGAWALLKWLGLALALVGLIDVAMLWYPARWASVDWEFGTISGTVDGMPLLTIGFGLITAAAVAVGRRGSLLAAGMVGLVVALLLVLAMVVFALDVPVALRAVDEQLKPTLKKSIVKTGLMAMVYVLLYLSLGISAVRRFRAMPKGV